MLFDTYQLDERSIGRLGLLHDPDWRKGCEHSAADRGQWASAGRPVLPGDAPGSYKPWSLVLLEVTDDRITAATRFLETKTLYPRFGRPTQL